MDVGTGVLRHKREQSRGQDADGKQRRHLQDDADVFFLVLVDCHGEKPLSEIEAGSLVAAGDRQLIRSSGSP